MSTCGDERSNTESHDVLLQTYGKNEGQVADLRIRRT
jgi:hypothetical protein